MCVFFNKIKTLKLHLQPKKNYNFPFVVFLISLNRTTSTYCFVFCCVVYIAMFGELYQEVFTIRWMVSFDKRLWMIQDRMTLYAFFVISSENQGCLRQGANCEIWLRCDESDFSDSDLITCYFLERLWVDDGVLEMLRGSLRPSLSIATFEDRNSAQEVELLP